MTWLCTTSNDGTVLPVYRSTLAAAHYRCILIMDAGSAAPDGNKIDLTLDLAILMCSHASKDIKTFIMKICIGSIGLILANSVIVEGGFIRSNLNNGAQCTKSEQCKSKCCSMGSRSKPVCVRKNSGSVCTEGNARIVPGTSKDWADAINEARKKYQDQYGGPNTYSALKWSNDLKDEAQKWANTVAANCQNGLPSSSDNPNDYGVATVLNMRNPQLAVDLWVKNGLDATKVPSTASHPFTQMIWATTEYVGCADANSNKSGSTCQASVCYYAYAGNCGWTKHDDWRDAVLDKKSFCSTVCPAEGGCAKINGV